MPGLLEYLTEDIPRSARENLPNILNRGIVAGTLGAPVDLMNMVMLGAGGEQPIGGSEWFGGLLEDIDAVTPRTGETSELVGELSASMMSPAGALKAGAVGGAGLLGLMGLMSRGARDAERVADAAGLSRGGLDLQRGAVGNMRHRRLGTTGQYVGGPDGVDSPQKLASRRRHFDSLAEEGAPGAEWYTRAREFNQYAANDPRSFSGAQAVTSSNTGVDANLGHAIKGHNQVMAGDAVQTGRFPVAHGDKIGRIYGGEDVNLGLKVGPYWQHTDPTRPHSERAVHDIWDARAWGYKHPDGSDWDAGLSDAQHRFLDIEYEKAAERANRLKLGGRDDWTVEKLQAASWVARRSKDMGMPVEDAARSYPEFANRHTTQLSWESTPGSTTGHLPDMASRPYAERQDYHDRVSGIIMDPQGRDRIASGYGLLTPPPGHINAPGMYTNPDGVLEINPGTQSLVLTGKAKGSQEMDDASRALVEATENTRAGLLGQNAWAYSRPMSGVNVDSSNMAQFALGRQVSEDELGAMVKAAQARFGNDVGVVSTPDGVRVLNFTGQDNEGFQKWARQYAQEAGLPKPIRSGADSDYRENNWQQDRFGETFWNPIIENERPAIQASFDRFAPGLAEELFKLDELMGRQGQTISPHIQQMRKAIADGGLAGLERLIRSGAVPSVVAAVALPYLVSTDQTQGTPAGLLDPT